MYKKNNYFNIGQDSVRQAQDADRLWTQQAKANNTFDATGNNGLNAYKDVYNKQQNGILAPNGDTLSPMADVVSPTTQDTSNANGGLDDYKKVLQKMQWASGDTGKNFADNFNSYYGFGGNYDNNTSGYGKWTNYGTVGSSGNVFGDDYVLDTNIARAVRDEYDSAKTNWLNERESHDSTYKAYQNMIDKMNLDKQKNYIGKMTSLKNDRQQSTAMGRGGLGTTESAYRRYQNNYDNANSQLEGNVNSTADDMLSRYKDAWSQRERANTMLNEQAKSDGSSALAEYLGRDYLGYNPRTMESYAVGDYDASRLGGYLSGNATIDKVKFDGDENEYSASDYLTKEQQNALQQELQSEYDKYGYFIDDKDKSTINNYLDGFGGGNDAYQTYLKAANEYSARQEQAKPENFAARGAVANVAGKSSGQKLAVEDKYIDGTKMGHTQVNIDGLNYNFNTDNNTKKLKKEAPDKIKGKVEGDVIEVENKGKTKRYVLYNGKWRKLKPIR